MFRVLVPRGVLEEKERGTLQQWFDMIDWQGVGIKEEQQAQGGMRFYVRGQTLRQGRSDGSRSKNRQGQKETKKRMWS
jgi:hypothetical protein